MRGRPVTDERTDYADAEIRRAGFDEAREEAQALLDYRHRRILALHIEVERRDRRIAELEAALREETRDSREPS